MTETQDLTFDEWLERLEAEDAKRQPSNSGWRLVEQTGRECWRAYYDDGYSPLAALLEDWSSQ